MYKHIQLFTNSKH